MESTFIKILGEFGIVPIMLLLVMIVWFLLREIKKEVGGVQGSVKGLKSEIENSNLGLHKSMDQMKEDLLVKMKELRERSDEKDAALLKKIDDLENRMFALEKDAVSRDQFYQAISGWRQEITSLNDLIVELGQKKAKGEKNNEK